MITVHPIYNIGIPTALSVAMSNALPHIQLPVGEQGGDKVLEGLFDSRAGLTVGDC